MHSCWGFHVWSFENLGPTFKEKWLQSTAICVSPKISLSKNEWFCNQEEAVIQYLRNGSIDTISL